MFLYILFFILGVFIGYTQTVTTGCVWNGGMGIYAQCNGGQGCTLNCNLTMYSSFGPMCNGTEQTGNCFGTSNVHQVVSTSVTLPTGCTAEITAEFKKRGTNCSNSGIDSGDSLLIKGYGGISSAPNPSVGFGISNADVILTFTQTSGSFIIRARANRSDEITTFTINYTGSCGPNCNQVLPIELVDFYGFKADNSVALKWQVKKEINLRHYLLERSHNGTDFSPLAEVDPQMPYHTNYFTYQHYDDKPLRGINYYRLTNIDLDGTRKTHPIIAVNFVGSTSNLWHSNSASMITIGINQLNYLSEFILFDVSGKHIKTFDLTNGTYNIPKKELSPGVYCIKDVSGQNSPYKLMVFN
jgi:hypothetical protein